MNDAVLKTYRYAAVRPDGTLVRDQLTAENEAAAIRQLSQDGLVVTRLAPSIPRRAIFRQSGIGFAQRVLIVRQLALMLGAGVPLLEALGTIASAAEGPIRGQLDTTAAGLRGGMGLGAALRAHLTGYPEYLYAMAQVGEASGKVADVLGQAAEQMAFEDRLRRDVLNALTYPAFLAASGVLAVGFIFVEVIPRFSAMLSSSGATLPLASRIVLGTGTFVSSHLLGLSVVLFLLCAAIAAAGARPEVRRMSLALLRSTPLVGAIINARQLAIWARLTAFALGLGVGLLPALALSRSAVGDARLAEGLRLAEADLRNGLAIDTALANRTKLTATDLSLLRSGQRSGTLALMFGYLASGYDDRLRDSLKRATALVEPLAIGLISVLVGVIVLSLVLALSTLYQSVG